MRIFSFVFVITSLALTANAFTMYESGLTADFEECAIDVISLRAFTITTTKALNNLTVKNVDASFDALIKDTDGLATATEEALRNCCSLYRYRRNEEDKKYAINEAVEYLGEFEAFASALTRVYSKHIAESQILYFQDFLRRVRSGSIAYCLIRLSNKKSIEVAPLYTRVRHAFDYKLKSDIYVLDQEGMFRQVQ